MSDVPYGNFQLEASALAGPKTLHDSCRSKPRMTCNVPIHANQISPSIMAANKRTSFLTALLNFPTALS